MSRPVDHDGPVPDEALGQFVLGWRDVVGRLAIGDHQTPRVGARRQDDGHDVTVGGESPAEGKWSESPVGSASVAEQLPIAAGGLDGPVASAALANTEGGPAEAGDSTALSHGILRLEDGCLLVDAPAA